jgi:hypothetical protein
MRSWFRRGATMIVLAGAVAFAVTQDKWTKSATAGADAPAAVKDAADDTTGSLGTVGIAQRDVLPLDSEQLSLIFLGVINLPDVPDTDMPLAMVTTALPDSIALRDLPAMVTDRIPQVKDYKFVKLDDRILLVSPDSRLVVAEIPRFKLIYR